RSSTRPTTGSTSGNRSIGDSTYSTIRAAASLSQVGAAGCRSAHHSCRASPRTSPHSRIRRFHIAHSSGLELVLSSLRAVAGFAAAFPRQIAVLQLIETIAPARANAAARHTGPCWAELVRLELVRFDLRQMGIAGGLRSVLRTGHGVSFLSDGQTNLRRRSA